MLNLFIFCQNFNFLAGNFLLLIYQYPTHFSICHSFLDMYNDIIQRGVARVLKGGGGVYMGVSQDIKEGGATGHQRRESQDIKERGHRTSNKGVSQDIKEGGVTGHQRRESQDIKERGHRTSKKGVTRHQRRGSHMTKTKEVSQDITH